MSTHFLQHVAQRLLTDAGSNDHSARCVVVPNRRAAVFLRHHLAQQTQAAIWAPAIITIDELMQRLGATTVRDRQSLLLDLYEVYAKVEAEKADPLEEFLSWANIFLSDLNELDLSMTNAEAVLAELHSLRRVESWDPSGATPGKIRTQYLERLRKQAELYTQFKQHLLVKGQAWPGLAYRMAVQNAANVATIMPYAHYYFVGLNALSEAELRVLKALKEEKLATFIWDIDHHYFDMPMHEAGMHVRKNFDRLKVLPQNCDRMVSDLAQQPRAVQVLGCPNSVTMARKAGALLDLIMAQNPDQDPSRVAVVLNDRSLLLPLLHSIPERCGVLNITMGFPFRSSPWYGFVLAWTELQLHHFRGQKGFYHRHLSRLFGHSVSALIMPNAGDVKNLPLRTKRVYIDPKWLIEQPDVAKNALGEVLIHPWKTGADVPQAMLQWCDQALKQLEGKEQVLHVEFAVMLRNCLQKLVTDTAHLPDLTVPGMVALLMAQLRMLEVPFTGEPLEGIQVMGLLESRTVDFDVVIMLSVNEGKLPAERGSQSDLTHDLRAAYGIPDQNEHEATSAYHFYRLMQRANQVHLLYNTDTDGLNTGEPSRYIRQWDIEKGPNTVMEHGFFAGANRQLARATQKHATKSPEVLVRLKSMLAFNLSPSALNTYRTCPFKYYMSYLVAAKEPDTLEDHLGHSDLGVAVHRVLELLYQPLIGNVITIEALDKLQPLVNDTVRNCLLDILSGREIVEREVLTERVIGQYTKRAIANDRHTVAQLAEQGKTLTLLGLEKPLKRAIQLSTTSGPVEVRIGGTIDRLDRISNGQHRIIDHKTGGFEKKKAKDLQPSSPEILTANDPKYSIAYQVLMYTWLTASEWPNVPVSAGINFLRSNAETFDVSFGDTADETNPTGLSLSDAEHWIEQTVWPIVQEMVDPEIPFEQTTDLARCAYCHLKDVCNR